MKIIQSLLPLLKRFFAPFLLPLILTAGGLSAQGEDAVMFPFPFPLDFPQDSEVDFSCFVPAPAGAEGFVEVRGDHFYLPGKDGSAPRRIRFLGFNITHGAAFPSHEDADQVADQMARLGINAVRFHLIDHISGSSLGTGSIFNRDGITFDPDHLEKFDYFFAALKRRGIYTNLNLKVARQFPAYRDVPGMPLYHKGIDQIIRAFIDLQKDYARDILTHENPYTGLSYRDDPALAIIEFNNENSVLEGWFKDRLSHLPPELEAEFTDRWNDWLNRNEESGAAEIAALLPPPSVVGAPLNANATFAEGDKGWKATSDPVGAIEVEAAQQAGEPALRLTLAADKKWSRFESVPCDVTTGAAYTLRLRATSSGPRQVKLVLKEANDPWRFVADFPVELAGGKVEEINVPFTWDGPDGSMRVLLEDREKAAGELMLSELALCPGGTGGLLPAIDEGRVALLQRALFSEYPPALQRLWVRFLFEAERDYLLEMKDYLKQDLGVKAILVGSSVVGYSLFPNQALLDAVDNHAYWDHPQIEDYNAKPYRLTFKNESLLGKGDLHSIVQPSLARVAGKPFLCTEYNHPVPNQYNAEGFPVIAAYAAMQDWDGIFFYSYAHNPSLFRSGALLYTNGNPFDISQHPAQMASVTVASSIFLRGDVEPADEEQVTFISLADILETARTRRDVRFNSAEFGVPPQLCLQKKVAQALAPEGQPTSRSGAASAPGGGRTITAANGQIQWKPVSPERNVVLVDSPFTQAVIGFGAGGTFALGDVVIEPGPSRLDHAMIAVTSQTDESITTSPRSLLVALGTTENTGMIWNDDHTALLDNGGAPVLTEGVPATLTFGPGRPGLTVWALDREGVRREQVLVQADETGQRFTIGPQYETIWYELAWPDQASSGGK